MGLRGRWAVWSSEMAPVPSPCPPPILDLVHTPTPPGPELTARVLRSLVGHSNLPFMLHPSHNPPSFGPYFVPLAVPHPHFWPELDRGNSSWQTPKAGMREIHKPDVLLQRGSGGWESERRGAFRASVPQQHLFRPRAGLGTRVHITQEPGQPKDRGEIIGRTSCQGIVEKAPGIWSLKACL